VIHPLIRLLATRPHLLATHLGGYAHLMRVQASDALVLARARAVLAACVAIGAALGTGLAGVAIILLGVVPVSEMPAPWLLLLAPAVPLAGAGACWWHLQRQPPLVSLDELQQQLAADAALLREASD
jgi:hypothetical protein